MVDGVNFPEDNIAYGEMGSIRRRPRGLEHGMSVKLLVCTPI